MNGRITALCIFLIVYAIYYATSFSSVTGGDSGELLAEACVSFLCLILSLYYG